MPHHWGSLRVQFMLLVILASIPVFGITLYRTVQDRGREQVAAQVNASLVARQVAGEHDRLTLETKDLLSELGGERPVREHNSSACNAEFASFLGRYPVYADVMAFTPDGTLFCSGLPSRQPTNYSDSPWFRHVLSTDDMIVGDYEVTRGDGEPGQPMALSTRDSTGRISAVIMATLDREWLGDFIARTQVASDVTITLLDRKSTVVTRYPDLERWSGKQWVVPDLRLWIGADEAAAESKDLDGSPRLFTAVPLGDSAAPVGSVLVGIPVEQAFAASTVSFWRAVAALAIIIACALGATWFGDKLLVGRHVRALADATRALAGGHANVRTGLAGTSGELGDLAASIDQMAEALERRERERLEMQSALVNSEERYRDLFENASDLILSVGPDGHFLYANRAWRDTLGYDNGDLAKLNFLDTVDSGERADCERILERVLSGERMYQVELTLVARDGRKILTEGSANCRFVDGEPHSLHGIFHDVTLRKQAEAKLLYLSSHDALTGLYNRGYFEEEMTRLAHSRRLPISIVVADVDDLKHTNDSLGHTAGDELLKQAARILRASFREEDMIARIGGDEFAVLLPNSSSSVAEEAITRVRLNIAAQNESGAVPSLCISLGTATASSGEMLMETLTAADAAMYSDKASRQKRKDSRAA